MKCLAQTWEQIALPDLWSVAPLDQILSHRQESTFPTPPARRLQFWCAHGRGSAGPQTTPYIAAGPPPPAV